MQNSSLNIPIQALELSYFYERPGLPAVPKTVLSKWVHKLGLNRERPTAEFRLRAAGYADMIVQTIDNLPDTPARQLLLNATSEGLADMWTYLHGSIEALQTSDAHVDDPGLGAAGVALGFWRLMHYRDIGHYIEAHALVLRNNPTPLLQVLPFLKADDLNDPRILANLESKTLLAIFRTPYWDRFNALVDASKNKELLQHMIAVKYAVDLYHVRANAACIQYLYQQNPSLYIKATSILMDHTRSWMRSAMFLRSRNRGSHAIQIFQEQARFLMQHYAYDWTNPVYRRIGFLAQEDRDEMENRIEYANLSYAQTSGRWLEHIFNMPELKQDKWFCSDIITSWSDEKFAHTCRFLSSIHHPVDDEYPSPVSLLKAWKSERVRDVAPVLAQSSETLKIALQMQHALIGILQAWFMHCRNNTTPSKLFDVDSLSNSMDIFSSWTPAMRAQTNRLDVFVAGAAWLVDEHFRFHASIESIEQMAWINALQRIWIELDVIHNVVHVSEAQIEELFLALPAYIQQVKILGVVHDDEPAILDSSALESI